MEEIIKEEEENNQQPQEKNEDDEEKPEEKKQEENQEIKQEKEKKEKKHEEEKKEENHEEIKKQEEDKKGEKHEEEKNNQRQKVNPGKNKKEEDSKNKKKEKELKQVKKNKLEKKIKEEIFIYFIANHEENSSFNVELDKSEFASDLKLLSEDNIQYNNNNYKYSIYRFKISNFKPEDKKNVKVKLKYKINNKNYDAKISIKDFNFDFDFDIFLYDIKLNSNPPQYAQFKEQDIFKIYIKYLRGNNLLQRSEENISLILSTLKFIICQKKYEFSFYLEIFMECFATKLSSKLIIEFDPNKIISPVTIEEKGIEQKDNILKVYIKKFEEKISLIEDKNDKMKYKINFYNIILNFYYFFEKEIFISLLNDEKKQMIYIQYY